MRACRRRSRRAAAGVWPCSSSARLPLHRRPSRSRPPNWSRKAIGCASTSPSCHPTLSCESVTATPNALPRTGSSRTALAGPAAPWSSVGSPCDECGVAVTAGRLRHVDPGVVRRTTAAGLRHSAPRHRPCRRRRATRHGVADSHCDRLAPTLRSRHTRPRHGRTLIGGQYRTASPTDEKWQQSWGAAMATTGRPAPAERCWRRRRACRRSDSRTDRTSWRKRLLDGRAVHRGSYDLIGERCRGAAQVSRLPRRSTTPSV